MLRRMKQDHTASMELPPKRSVKLPLWVLFLDDVDMSTVLFCTMSSLVKLNVTSREAL